LIHLSVVQFSGVLVLEYVDVLGWPVNKTSVYMMWHQRRAMIRFN